MTLSDLAALGSLVSGIAVLVSLIYLARQVQQSSKHTAAQISHSRVQFGAQQQNLLISDPEIAKLMMRGNRGDPNLTDVDGFRFWFLLSNSFLMMEDEFRQFKVGLISNERHNGFVKRISIAMQLPGYRAMWKLQRAGFEADFQAFMDALMREARKRGEPPDISLTWRETLAAEIAPYEQ